MRKVVAGLAISLGGVAESPADWRFRHQTCGQKGVCRA